MTDDQIRSLRDDITYMKALADEGSRGPLLGGSILVAAGAIFAVASVIEWAIATDLLAVDPIAHAVNWLTAMALFTLALVVLIRRQKGRPGQMSPSNRAFANAWMGVGLAIFSLAISLTVVAFRAQSELPLLVYPSLIVALYGSGWAVSAAMSGQRWLWALAIGGWAAAPVLAFFTGDPVQYLVYAACLVLLALIPGIVLMRQEPSDVV